MKKFVPLLIATLACSVPQLAAAVPINATYTGTVSGSSGIFGQVLNDFPIGTSASFDVTFDDSGFVDDAALVNDFDLAPVTGWLRMGALEWVFDAGRIYTYTYMFGPGNPVTNYGLQLTGTGPTIGGGANAALFGLFLSLTPDGAPNAAASGPKVGFAYPVESGEYYSYADLYGDFTTTRENPSVPEPPTGVLMCGALALLLLLRRQRVTAR